MSTTVGLAPQCKLRCSLGFPIREEADSRGAGASDVKALSLKSLQTAIVSGKAATLRCCSATHDQSETLRLSKLNDVRAQAQALNPAVPKTLSIPVPQMPPASR